MNMPILALTRDPEAANRPSRFVPPPLPSCVASRPAYVKPSDVAEAIDTLRRELRRAYRPAFNTGCTVTLSRAEAEALLVHVYELESQNKSP